MAVWIVASLLVTTWIGYPLVVAALAGLVRRGRASGPTTPVEGALPLVSVVVASRDDLATLRQRVADILASAYPAERLEVVLALDAAGPTEVAELRVLVDSEPGTVLVRGDAPGGKAAALNAGVRAARGEILVFTDARQSFEPAAIPRLVAALLGDPRLGAVSGRLELPDTDGRPTLVERYWRLERWLRREEAVLHSPVGVTGAIYAMRRRLWTPLPAGLILDDLYVPMRLVLDGWRVGFEDGARARDARRTDPQQEFRRKVRTLTGNVQLCAWLPAVLVPWRNPIWLQFVCHKLLRLLTPYLLLVLLTAAAWKVAVTVGGWTELGLAVAAGIALVILVVLGVPPLRRRLQTQLAWGLSLQWAIVVATVNGLRGRWNVWH